VAVCADQLPDVPQRLRSGVPESPAPDVDPPLPARGVAGGEIRKPRHSLARREIVLVILIVLILILVGVAIYLISPPLPPRSL
jgi:hypothetical protein